jgi:hypothetical protein
VKINITVGRRLRRGESLLGHLEEGREILYLTEITMHVYNESRMIKRLNQERQKAADKLDGGMELVSICNFRLCEILLHESGHWVGNLKKYWLVPHMETWV